MYNRLPSTAAPSLKMGLVWTPPRPHNVARNSYQEVAGVLQQAPAPRFSRTPAAAIQAPRVPGEDAASVLADCGLTATEGAQLTEQGVVSG